MPRLWAYLFCLATIPSLAATKVTVEQMGQILASALGQPDEKLNRRLQTLELTERLNANLRARWVADLPGPASRQTLLVLAAIVITTWSVVSAMVTFASWKMGVRKRSILFAR